MMSTTDLLNGTLCGRNSPSDPRAIQTFKPYEKR